MYGYRGKPLKELTCPWCGESPSVITHNNEHNPYDDYASYSDTTRYWITLGCNKYPKCNTSVYTQPSVTIDSHSRRGNHVNDLIQQGIEQWQRGEIVIPFRLELPKNIKLLSKIPKVGPSWVKKTELKFWISNERGIMKHIHDALEFMSITDHTGKHTGYHPYAFTLSYPVGYGNEQMFRARITDYNWGRSEFTFTGDESSSYPYRGNKADGGWLKKEASNGHMAPINDFLLNKIRDSVAHEEDEDDDA
jgi:hypothetical protein